MRRDRRNSKSRTPIDAKQQALFEQQEKVRQKMERLQRLIDEAPKIARENEKKRQEQLVVQSSRRHARHTDVPVLQDKRFELQATVMPARRSRKALKAERRARQLIFITLFFVLVLVVVWIWKIKPW